MPAPRPRAACSACSKRTAACHQSSTIVASGSASRCSRHSPASPSHSTVAGVSALTPAAASACLNASDAVAGPLRAKAKRCWAPRASITLPATTSKWRSPPVPAAHVAAIEPDHDGAGRLRRGRLRSLGRMPLHDLSPTRIVLLRTVPAFCAPLIGSSSDRRVATLPNGDQRRIPGRHVGQLRRDRVLAEVEGGEALRLARALTGADEQPSDAHRHVAEQGAERRGVMALAGQPSSTGHAPATTLARHGHLCRHDLSLERRCELLRLIEPKPELGQAGLLIALDASNLGLRHHAGLQLRNQLHPPHQFRHQPTLFP